MTAAGRREELEALIWRALTTPREDGTTRAVMGILAAADAYAQAAVDDDAGSYRLQVAAAEYGGRTP